MTTPNEKSKTNLNTTSNLNNKALKEINKKWSLMGKDLILSKSHKLENLTLRNLDTKHINYKVYYILCDPFTFINAYARISKNKGALTKGITIDKEIMANFSLNIAENIANKFKKNTYNWSPTRRVWIPKPFKTTKRPPIDTPTQEDRIVQEAIRGILEAIFEPEFQEFEKENNYLATNYGFRPNKSTWNAVEQLKLQGQATNIAIEGDIKGAYNSVNHSTLLNRMSERIKDKKFLKVIKNLLKTGVMDKNQFTHSLGGTPQGGIVSPILFNIYMFNFDKYMYNTFIKPTQTQTPNPIKRNTEYTNLGYKMKHHLKEWQASKKSNNPDESYLKSFRDIQQTRFKIPVYEINTLPKKAIYVRYADDWVLMFTGTQKEAIKNKEKISDYLLNELKMILDPTKTFIKKVQDGIHFLGYTIQMWSPEAMKLIKVITQTQYKTIRALRRTTSRKITILPHKERVLNNLILKKFCQPNTHYPIGVRGWTHYSEFDIVLKYRQVMLGIVNYYRNCDQTRILNYVSYILQYSCAKTLAARRKETMPQIFDRYGKNLTITQTFFSSNQNTTRTVKFSTYTDLKREGRFEPLHF